MPLIPNAPGEKPRSWSSDGTDDPPAAAFEPDGGTNGDQLAVLMKNSPATITSSTIASLMTTITKFTWDEILMPRQITAVRMSTIAAATRLCFSPYAQLGMVMPIWSITSAKYVDQPTATVLAPSASSRIRSQPMIQATSSPRLVSNRVYATRSTGTVLSNSA